MRRIYVGVAVLAVLLLIALPVTAQTIWQTYGNVRTKQLNATGAADMDSTLNVDGAATLRGTTTIPSGASLVVASGGTLTTNGYVTSNLTNLVATGDIKADTATITTTATIGTGNLTTLNVSGESKLTGNTRITGTLNVVGATTLAAVGATAATFTGLTVNGSELITGSSTISGSQNIVGNLDTVGNIEAADHLLTQAEFYMIPPTPVAVTDNGVITPTGAVVELTAAGTVGASLAPAGDGQFVILINTANETITISETSTARIAGDFAMGQYDTLTLIGEGVTWHEVARSNN